MFRVHAVSESPKHVDTRREFIRGSSLLIAGALPSSASATRSAPQGSPAGIARKSALKIGLVGCGFRGVAAATHLLGLSSHQGAGRAKALSEFAGMECELTLSALADIFPDRLQQALRCLRGRYAGSTNVPLEHRFVGFDGFRRLLEKDLDLVILATPPVFRPLHLEEAVGAGKHIYAEMPLAVDVPGVRRMLAASERAEQQGLAIRVGLGRRRNAGFQHTLEQLRTGAVGRIQTIDVGWYGSAPQQPEQPASIARSLDRGTAHPTRSPLEQQLRNWTQVARFSGSEIVERHVRDLDAINCILQSHPLCVRAVHENSNSCIEYTYADGAKVRSQRLSPEACKGGKNASLIAKGNAGWCDIVAGKIFNVENQLIECASSSLIPPADLLADPLADLLTAIATGQNLNDLQFACESTQTALMGRMAAQSTRPLNWDECLHCNSVLSDAEQLESLGDRPLG